MVRHCNRAVKRKKHGCSIATEDVEHLWKQQDGRCALSGIAMYLPENSSGWTKSPTRVSLDRIDSSVGYEPDNIQLVTCMANYCKHTWANEDVIEFAKAVASFQHRA